MEVKIKRDPIYERIGLDLVRKTVVSIQQAYKGANIPVETPWGEVILTIPQSSQGGQKLRLKGRGIQQGKKRGDLFVQIAIRIPKKQDSKILELVEALEKIEA